MPPACARILTSPMVSFSPKPSPWPSLPSSAKPPPTHSSKLPAKNPRPKIAISAKSLPIPHWDFLLHRRNSIPCLTPHAISAALPISSMPSSRNVPRLPLLLPERTRMPFAQLSGVSIHYEWNGPEAAPVLVFCHSLGASHRLWDAQIEAFSRHFRILRYDSRGHGESGVPQGPYNVEQLARDVIQLLDVVGVRRVSF